MKKLLTLTLSLLMALSLCLTISAEGDDNKYFAIGDVEYSNLKDALNAVNSSSSSDETTIKLLAERTENGSGSSSSFSIDSGKNIVLDLNGNTLTLDNYSISCYGNLTITGNGQIEFTGWNSSSGGACISVGVYALNPKDATFTLRSGTIKNTSSEYSSTIRVSRLNGTAAKVIINGGSIESSGNVACIKAKNSGATAEVNGGTFKGSNIFVEEDGGKITVSSGTFSSDVSVYLASGSTIVKYNNEYTVYGANDTVSVNEDTKALAGLSSAARKVLNEAGSTADGKTSSIKDADGNLVTVNSSTQLVLSAKSEEPISQEAFGELKDEIEAAIGTDISNIKNNEVFEILLSATNNGAPSQIRDLGDGVEMPVSLYLSENVKNELTGKTIKVLRVDEGDDDVEIVSLDVIGLSGNVLTFNSSKFSPDDSSNDFIICAITSSSGGNTDSDTNTNTNTNTSTKSYDAKDKNKDGVISCEEEMNSANWIWSTSKQTCVYKVTNTSVK